MTIRSTSSHLSINRKAATRPAQPPAMTLDGVRAGINYLPVDLTIIKGTTVTAFGNSSDALSRLLDTIAGFYPLLGGRILIGSEDVSTLRAGKRGIALVSTRDPLFDHLDVRENIGFSRRAAGRDRSEIRAETGRMIALLGLDGLDGRKPEALTSEQKLRVSLARALMTAPAVLLLDDPLSHLDAHSAQKISNLLATLSRALDLTIFHAVSRREDALRPGGPVAVFQNAVLLQCADAARLYEHPASPEVAIAFGEANALTGQVLEISDDVARVHLACGGVAEAVATENLKEGDECLVCIRPDRVAPFFGTQSLGMDDDLPPLQGTLAHSLHFGDHIRMRVRFADGTEIELRRPPLQARQIPKTGAPVQIAWPAAHATAFPLRTDLY
ncbi:ABC transporter ATP-binding protein [Gluconobacter wancherniae]|uniref:ABC transporter ATP-binding protein n=1 Tax=Gluconobacter wancherniae TaxID=1307955 RepID=UPI001B8D037B|nr:ABC transporter ATP-binding protein [Gluconobacter wancherniae]MBS1089486.1 ABC transporter ATP-binding protein [Gluconobacter wancherniae]